VERALDVGGVAGGVARWQAGLVVETGRGAAARRGRRGAGGVGVGNGPCVGSCPSAIGRRRQGPPMVAAEVWEHPGCTGVRCAQRAARLA